MLLGLTIDHKIDVKCKSMASCVPNKKQSKTKQNFWSALELYKWCWILQFLNTQTYEL